MNLNLRTKCIVLENIFTISNLSEQPQGFNYAREKAGTFYCQYHSEGLIQWIETIVFLFKSKIVICVE